MTNLWIVKMKVVWLKFGWPLVKRFCKEFTRQLWRDMKHWCFVHFTKERRRAEMDIRLQKEVADSYYHQGDFRAVTEWEFKWLQLYNLQAKSISECKSRGKI